VQSHELHTCGKIGRKNSILCATLGVLVACLLLIPLGAIGIAVNGDSTFKLILFIGLGSLYLAASSLGKIAGRFLCKTSNLMPSVIIGVGLALGCLAISVLTGSLSLVIVNMISRSPDSTHLVTYLVVPLFVVFVYGGVPAVLLGVLYGVLVRKQLAKVRAQTEAEQALGADSP
jgi:hypothetical protein